jgi:O-antigen/teichoic acid export membrane protein
MDAARPDGDGRMWLIAANYVVSAQGLASGPIVARLLGPEGRGQIATVQTVVYLVCALAAVGSVSALNGRPSTHSARAMWVGSRSVRRVILVLSLLSVPGALIASRAVGLDQPALIGLCAFAAACFNPIVTARTGIFLARGLYRRLLVGRVLSASILLGGLAIIMLAGDSAAIVACLYLLVSCTPALIPLPPSTIEPDNESISEVKAILRADIPSLAAASFLNVSNARVDQAILPIAMNNAQLGHYAVGVTYGSLVGPLSSALASLIMRSLPTHRSHLRFPWRPMIVLAICSAALAALSIPVIPLMFGTDFKPAVSAAMILCFAGLLQAGVAVVSGQLIAIGAGRSLIAGELVALATIPLTLPFSSRWGVDGAAWAACVCYGSNFVIVCLSRNRLIHKKQENICQ